MARWRLGNIPRGEKVSRAKGLLLVSDNKDSYVYGLRQQAARANIPSRQKFSSAPSWNRPVPVLLTWLFLGCLHRSSCFQVARLVLLPDRSIGETERSVEWRCTVQGQLSFWTMTSSLGFHETWKALSLKTTKGKSISPLTLQTPTRCSHSTTAVVNQPLPASSSHPKSLL